MMDNRHAHSEAMHALDRARRRAGADQLDDHRAAELETAARLDIERRRSVAADDPERVMLERDLALDSSAARGEWIAARLDLGETDWVLVLAVIGCALLILAAGWIVAS